MNIQLNADTCALAIVTAAQAYGDHPMQAMTAQRGMKRRSLAAAVHALVEGTGLGAERVCGVLGTSMATFKAAERDNALPFRQARHAAFRAIAPGVRPSWETPPGPAPKSVDHSDAIKAALDRRKAQGLTVTVAGVQADRARLAQGGAGGCRAHLHLKDLAVCDAQAVQGRLFCVEHCRATGQKTTPVDLAPAVMPARYSDKGAR